MSAETIPADVVELVAKTIHDHWQGAPGLSARPWDGEKGTCAKLPAQAEDFRRKARAVLKALATRPAEPAAPVAEAVDGDVIFRFPTIDQALKEMLDVATSQEEGAGGDFEDWDVDHRSQIDIWQAGLAEGLEAERARADELRLLLTASGRCVDDLTARLDAFEHAQEKARDEGFNHALSILEDALGSPTYYAADGSETWEGDTRGTIYNLLRASGVWRGDDDMLVTKDRDFWKERFQVESRSRIQAEQRAADALARAEKVKAAAKKAIGDDDHEKAADWHDRQAQDAMNSLHCGSENWVYREAHKVFDLHSLAARAIRFASREAQPATDGGEA